jgi:hypothetical protein
VLTGSIEERVSKLMLVAPQCYKSLDTDFSARSRDVEVLEFLGLPPDEEHWNLCKEAARKMGVSSLYQWSSRMEELAQLKIALTTGD